MIAGVGRGPLQCNNDKRGSLTRVCDGYRCRLRVTRAAMMATVNVTITQQIVTKSVLFGIMKTKK